MKAGAKKTVRKVAARKVAPRKKAVTGPAAGARDDAREQLAAVSQVTRALADPAVDLDQVADMIVEATLRLSGSETAAFFRRDPDGWVLAAMRGVQPGKRGARATPLPGTIWGRAALGGKRFHYADTAVAKPKLPEPGKRRTRMAVPIVRDGESIAVLTMSRADPGGFDKATIALVETFADQLAVAMTNARLLKDATDALERQTATAEILRAISGSLTDAQPVFDAVVERAALICDADMATVSLRAGDSMRVVAGWNMPTAWYTTARIPIQIDDGTAAGRVYLEGRTVVWDDFKTVAGMSATARKLQRLSGARSTLAVPVRRGDEVTGVIVLRRITVRPFAPEHVALIESFADQAAIAIENVRLFNETKESLEQQTAISNILRVISRSSTEIQPVLDAIAENASRYCQAEDATLMLPDGPILRGVAHFGPVPSGSTIASGGYPIDGRSISGRAFVEGRVVHTADILAEADQYPLGAAHMREVGGRAGVAVPLLREGSAIGILSLRRREPRAFTEKQIDLLRTFADQAAIAIENVRLFTETKEALEQQTATSEILGVIAASPSEIAPVLDAIAESAARFCAAENVTVVLEEDGMLHPRASFGGLRWGVDPYPVDRTTVSGRAIVDGHTVQVADLQAGADEYPRGQAQALAMGHRTAMAAPLIRDGRGIGALLLRRSEVRPFTEKQLELVRIFADQAVIAIENVRLFNQTKESLERQTAISEILRAISSSPTDVQPVLDTIAESAARFCGADDAGVVVVGEDGNFQLTETVGRVPQAAHVFSLVGRTVTTLSIQNARLYNAADMEALSDDEFADGKQYAREFGYRAFLAAPLLKDGRAIGCIQLRRNEPGAFSPAQVDLVQTFAAQAVIALDNVRLFNETKEALERQTAISEILRVISSSPTDVRPVLDAIVENALRFCAAEDAAVMLPNGDHLQLAAHCGSVPVANDLRYPNDGTSVSSRAFREARTITVQDLQTAVEFPLGAENARSGGYHAIVGAPLLRDGAAVGAIVLRRFDARPFSDREIDALETFAAQAVIAIENARLFNETKEALERQTAIGDILRVISGSVTDIQPVLDAIASSAARFAMAEDASVLLVKGDEAVTSAHFGPLLMPPSVALIEDGWVTGRAIREVRTIQLEDATLAGDEYRDSKAAAIRGDHRAVLAAPLVRDGKPLGAIVLRRRDPRLFSDRQVELVQTFADQAAIAISNVRLFNETTDALARQTATAEILRVMATSPTDVRPVLDAIAETAARICGASDAHIYRVAGGRLVQAAHFGPIPGLDPGETLPLDRASVAGRSIVDRQSIHMRDAAIELTEREYPVSFQLQRRWGYHTVLTTPLLRDDQAIGAIAIRRTEVDPFTPQQIDLLKTFADQAAIAMENVRLFNETKEALERQTAMGEILRVISGSPTDVQPVLDAIAASASKFAGADDVSVFIVQGADAVASAHIGPLDNASSIGINAESVTGRAILERRLVHVPDVRATDEFPRSKEVSFREDGQRAVLSAPLLRNGEALGAIVLRRREPQPFSERQIELVQTFADQAVIALANTRLFKETREALERQTATAELLAAMSQSAFDLKPVFEMVLDKSLTLCRAEFGWIRQTDGNGDGRIVASRRPDGAAMQLAPTVPIGQATSVMGRAYRERRSIHIHDVTADPTVADSKGMIDIGARTGLGVPLLRGDDVLGVLVLVRIEVRPFEIREIELVESFARQAAIAIENVRLFNEIQEKSAQLEVANRHKTEFLANMSHELRTPLNAVIGFSEVLLQRMFGELNPQQADYLEDIRSSGTHLLSLINDILDLSKIEAGRMELELAPFSLVAALNNAVTLVRERAQGHGIKLELDVAPALDTLVADERKLKQVVVNLLTNAVKFTPDGGTVRLRAERDNGQVRLAVHDTGIGIAPEDQERIFEEFQQAGHQTERSREGTGLGLALSRRMVELHGGTITVDSAPGKGSTFTVALPLQKEA